MCKILYTIILTSMLVISGASAASASWQLSFDVSTPDPESDTGTATNRITVGSERTATDAYDNKFDTVALLKGPVEAYVVHPEYPSEQQRLWRDFRSTTLPNEWKIAVNAPVDGSAINIKWVLNAPDNLSFILIDLDNNNEIGIRSTSEYSFNSTSNNPKNFLLRVSQNTAAPAPAGGSSDGVAATGDGIAAKGGGCGHIKDINGNKTFPGNTGSAASTMAILFVPVIWLTVRKTIFSHALRSTGGK